jgi:Fe-S cluster assembly protein SufD
MHKTVNSVDPLDVWRAKARTRLSSVGAPSLFAAAAPAIQGDLTLETLTSFVWPECALSYLVLVDGHFVPALSSIPKGIVCHSMGQALHSYSLFLQARWTKRWEIEKDPFALLNGAMQAEGAFLYFPPKFSLAQPLQILHVLTGENLASPHLQIALASGASANIVQTFHPLSSQSKCNARVDLALEVGSKLKTYNFSLLPPEAQHANGWRATLKRGASLEMFHASCGSAFSRLSTEVELLEEESSVLLQGLGLLSHQRKLNTFFNVEHKAPSCRSRQHVKTVLQGESRSEFEGKIFVQPEAQKTEGYQLNQNLLLGANAMATTKPNLEILADDVKASHGATTVQFTEEETFYLRSRGLSFEEARGLLAEGFCREFLASVPFDSARETLLLKMRGVLQNNER